MRAHPEFELQVMVHKFVRECVPQPYFFTSVDRHAPRSAMDHVRQAAAGFVSGTPDTFLLMPGRVICIELKAPGNKPTERQFLVGDRIQQSGHTWGWCDSVAGYGALLSSIGVGLRSDWERVASGKDATLLSASITREESATGKLSRKRYGYVSPADHKRMHAVRARAAAKGVLI